LSQNHRNVFSGCLLWVEKSKFVNIILKSDLVFSSFAWPLRLHTRNGEKNNTEEVLVRQSQSLTVIRQK